MSIKDFLQKIKLGFNNIILYVKNRKYDFELKNDLYIVILIILVGTVSFGLGKLSSLEKNKTPISIIKTSENLYASALNTELDTNIEQSNSKANGLVLASKTGTKYYYPWCTGANRIKESNKVWFNSIEEARAAGLTPASNCIGLK